MHRDLFVGGFFGLLSSDKSVSLQRRVFEQSNISILCGDLLFFILIPNKQRIFFWAGTFQKSFGDLAMHTCPPLRMEKGCLSTRKFWKGSTRFVVITLTSHRLGVRVPHQLEEMTQ